MKGKRGHPVAWGHVMAGPICARRRDRIGVARIVGGDSFSGAEKVLGIR